MKQIKFPIFSFILFLCFFTKSFEVTHISRNLCQKSMKIIVNWPTKLNEKIKSSSSEKLCQYNINCRSYQEILDIAACKSSKFAGSLPLDKDLYYIMTWHQPKSLEEWGKFIYAIVDNKVPFSNSYQGDIEFVKVCIPVNGEKKAFLDEKCPLDDCNEKWVKSNSPCLVQMSNLDVRKYINQILRNITSIKKFL